MKIASINPESTIDYPGNYGPVIFTSGCNFRCGYCHNPELINSNGQGISEDNLGVFLNNLEIKTKRGWYKGVCITGGEPTIHPELHKFLFKLKNYGLAIKLDTNGSNPSVLENLLDEKLVDYVAMDVKGPPFIYGNIIGGRLNRKNIEQSMKLVSKFPDYEFRTTIIPVENSFNPRFINVKEMENVAKWIVETTGNNSHKYYLQKFIARNNEEIVDSSFSKENLPKDMRETPDKLMKKIHQVVLKYIPNCEIR